jgi:hypothetical protein
MQPPLTTSHAPHVGVASPSAVFDDDVFTAGSKAGDESAAMVSEPPAAAALRSGSDDVAGAAAVATAAAAVTGLQDIGAFDTDAVMRSMEAKFGPRLGRVREIEAQLSRPLAATTDIPGGRPYKAQFEQRAGASKLIAPPAPEASAARAEAEGLQEAARRAATVTAEAAARLHRERLEELRALRCAAREHAFAMHLKCRAAARRLYMDVVAHEQSLLRRLSVGFRANEEHMRVHLEGRGAEVEMSDMGVKRQGRHFNMQDRSYAVEWGRAPQPVAVHLRCCRAVKEKLPRGQYIVRIALFDRLAGRAMGWSGDDFRAQEKQQHSFRWIDVTNPIQHGGDHRDVEMSFNQSLRVVLPAAAMLAPSAVWIFSLHYVGDDSVAKSACVGWSAFPIFDSRMRLLQGKFRTPLLVGDVDASMDKYSMMECAMAEDLNRWLCNLYFEVEQLDRLQEGERQRNYTVPLQYTAEMLGFVNRGVAASVMHQVDAHADWSSGRGKTSSSDQKYDMVVRHAIARSREKSVRSRLAGSKDTAERLLGGSKSRTRHHDRLRRGLTAQKLFGPAATAPASHARSEWCAYRYSVAGVAPSAGSVYTAGGTPEPSSIVELALVRRGVWGQIHVFWRELQWELWSAYVHRYRSADFCRRAVMGMFACCTAVYIHYVAQWVWLSVFLWSTTVSLRWVPVGVTYDNQQMTSKMEMGTVCAGGVANFVECLLLSLVAIVFRCFYHVPRLFSDFTDAFALYTLISPLCIAVYDFVRGNTTHGDLFKLYVFHDRTDRDGAVGAALTAVIYITWMVATGALCYVYFLHLHQNGRITDVIRRLEATEGEMWMPDDAEISMEELRYLCSAAQKWNKGGATRTVRVTEHRRSSSQVDAAGDSVGGDGLIRRGRSGRRHDAPDAITRVWIEQQGSDGTAKPFRAFQLQDGAVVELFEWAKSATQDNKVVWGGG